MPVDVSPYATLGQGGSQTNLLGPFATYAYAQNALNQNALFQQTFRARAAMGPLAQASVDPATGQMDYTKFATLIATHPETAFMAPEVINQLTQRQLTQAELVRTNLQVAGMKQGAIASAAFSAANGITGDPAAAADTKGVIGNMAQLLSVTGPDGQPLVTPQEAVAYASGLGQYKTNGDLKAHLLQIAQAGQSMSDNAGALSWQTVVGPDGQPRTVAFSKLTGGPAGAPQPGQTLGGAPGMVPSPAGGGGGPGPAPGPAPLPTTPSEAAPVVPGAGAAPASPPTAPTNVGGPLGTPTAPTTAQSAGLDYIAKTYYPQLQQAAQQATQVKNMLGEARSLIRNFDPGRAAEWRTDAARWATAAGMSPDTVAAIQGGDVSSAQALQKLTTTMATQWMRQANEGNAAVRSVQEWQKFQAAFPNIENDPKAIGKMYDFMDFVASLTQAEQRGFDQYKAIPGADVTTWPGKWNTVVNEMSQKYWGRRNAGQAGPVGGGQ
jgi:hypothetical protein